MRIFTRTQEWLGLILYRGYFTESANDNWVWLNDAKVFDWQLRNIIPTIVCELESAGKNVIHGTKKT